MVAKLNNGILITGKVITNSKASEMYVPAKFTYPNSTWEGYVPIEYRRTGLSIDPNDTDSIYAHLNYCYEEMNPSKFEAWKTEQLAFWKTEHSNSKETREFFDILLEGGWKCGSCEMPRNPNPQRRIQDLKEYGYTIATNLKRYCPNCRRNTSQRIMLPIPRCGNQGNGYETWSPELRKRIIRVLGGKDVYEETISPHVLPDHKFPEIRWDDETKADNPETMTDDEIRAKFQLMTNQRNQQKREVCRNCFQTGVRPYPFGIEFYYQGDAQWNPNIPVKGKAAEQGCVGCGWYDMEEWRHRLCARLTAYNQLVEKLNKKDDDNENK